MPNIRIKDIPTTASATSSTDFIGIDGSANGTRKLNAYSPTFGGNLTVSGATSTITLGSTNTGSIAVDANGALTVTPKAGQAINLGNTASTAAQLFSLADYAAGISLKNSSVASADVRNWAIRTDDANFGDFNIKQSATRGGDAFSGVKRLVIDKDGNVSVPSGNLTVSGTGTSTFAGAITANGPLTLTAAARSVAMSAPASGGVPAIIGTTTNHSVKINAGLNSAEGEILFSTDGTERARLFANGNLFIGASPVDGGQKLQVSGSAALAGDLLISTNSVINFTVHDAYLRSAGGKSIFLQPAGTTALTLDSSQRVVVANATNNGSRFTMPNNTAIAWNNAANSGDGGSVYFDNTNALQLRTGSGASLALTLDSSQNATFAGTITSSTSTPQNGQLQLNVGRQTLNDTWGIQLGNTYAPIARILGRTDSAGNGTGSLLFYTGTGGGTPALALTLDSSQNATFAGNVTAPRLNSVSGTTSSVADGAYVDVALDMPKALVSYIAQSNGNSNHMSAGFFRSNDNGANSEYTLFGQSELNIAVTYPSAGKIRLTNNTGATVAIRYAFTVISGI